MAANICITGNLGRNPELRALESGQMVTKFTIAARQPKIRGEDQPALWFTVEVWGAPGEWIANNMRKGDAALVTGELCLRQWADKQTNEVREALTIKYARVEKLAQREAGPPAQGGGYAAAPAARPAPAAASAAAPVARPAAPAYQQAAPAPRPVAAPPHHNLHHFEDDPLGPPY
jgi:single stranded DNA-binding protein